MRKGEADSSCFMSSCFSSRRSHWTMRIIPDRPAGFEVTSMPTYAYVAMNSSGQEVKEEVDANSSEEAIAKIRSKGYFPTKVKEKAAKKAKKGKGGAAEEAPQAAKKKMPMSIGGVPRKQLVAFTRQLSTLQDAGLPILRSLQILEQQQKPGLLKAIIGGVT